MNSCARAAQTIATACGGKPSQTDASSVNLASF